MELRRELALSLGILVLLNLLLAFGTIGLLVRLGPVIEDILQENVQSITAAEGMLAEFARAGDAPLDAAARARVEAAFSTVEHNITEPGEKPVVDGIGQNLPRALDGDAAARLTAVRRVEDLISLNREAMQGVDAEARRLTAAGAWTAVVLGFLSFLFGLLVVIRLRRRFLGPLEELYDTLDAAQRGDLLRRCRAGDGPREVERVIDAVNVLLDVRLRQATRGPEGRPIVPGPSGSDSAGA